MKFVERVSKVDYTLEMFPQNGANSHLEGYM